MSTMSALTYAGEPNRPAAPARKTRGVSMVAHNGRRPSFGTPYSASLWPKFNGVATVFYVIDPASDPNATAKIQTALATINADFSGVIAWVQWTSPSTQGPNYVDINLAASDTSGQCEALEGYEAVPGQRMWGSTNCTVGTILHEMGHVIGLWHEQARPDAAGFIQRNYTNVIKGSWSNFLPPPDNYQTLGLYDYASLMQYPAYAFSRNGGPVIETIPPGIPLNGSDGVPVPTRIDYSATDKEGIMRLYGAAPTRVTVTSNPMGLAVSVDGKTLTTPQSFAWLLNSTHTLDVPSGVQTLSGNIVNSTTPAKFYYTYGRWNDSKQRSHTITIKPGNGEVQFPVTSPAIATYSANFIQLVPYKAAIYPAKAGQVAVSPLPKSYGGVSGKFFIARQPIILTAQAATGWSFYEFNNAPFWLPGGLGANPKSLFVPDTGNSVNTTVEFSNQPVYAIRFVPDSPTSNLSVNVDGGFAYTPKNFSPFYDSSWTPGSMHTVSFSSPEYPYSVNSRFAFVGWNAPGPDVRKATHSFYGTRTPAIAPRVTQPILTVRRVGNRRLRAKTLGPDTVYSETVTLPSTSTAYSATIAPQFAPITNFGYPPCGGNGTLSPPSPTQDGFYPAGQALQFTATALGGWTFAGWSYDLSGSASPATLTATDETLVFATFNTSAVPLTFTSLSPAMVSAGSPTFMLTINGTGFSPASLVSFNGTYRAVTFVRSTQLKIVVSAADIAAPAAFQVFVENFPSGWTGCAVFGYHPFFVS